jgi:RNA:NAD 2'-phosphotransferase (TPT1/KptA family)
MQLILSAHALERMAERNITESDIGALIRNCPKPRRDMKDNAIYYGLIYGWTVQVVVTKASQPPRVITVKVTK